MDESDFKTRIAAKLRKEGGYGRRIEDKFGVGIYDLILIPAGGPVFFTEAKIIRSPSWGATPRQAEELRRIVNSVGIHGWGCEIGFNVATSTISLRRLDEDDAERHHHYKVGFWTQLDVTGFLRFADKDWRSHV